jgi:hypothetical protein
MKPWMYIRGSGAKSRWSHSGMSGSMKKRHTEERILRTRRGVASRMSLRHLPTNAGQGRPAEIQRCCGRKPQHCLRCDRSSPMDGVPRLGSRRVRRLPAPAHRLFCTFFSARAGSIPWACSFLFGRWSSAKRMTVSSLNSTGNPYADRTHP